MKTTAKFTELVEQSVRISNPYLLPNSRKQIEEEKSALLAELAENTAVKVPIVGDFSAGKSSLLNCYIGHNWLPVDITPETAIAYELYYSENEYAELYRDGKKIEEQPINEIKALKSQAGDVAKVFIKSDEIRNLQNKGIILVDMPGIDSGIKEHNDAILHYIQKGSSFILLVDIGQGSLRKSTLAFMTELGKYNLKPAVLISKIDKKPESELKEIKEYITFQAKQAIGSDTFVGCISALNKNINDFIQYVNGIDSDTLVSQRFSARVSGFINLQIASLSTQVDLAQVNIQDIDKKLQELEEEKNKLIAKLSQNTTGDKPEKSTQDILDAVKEELTKHSEDIVSLIFQGEDPEQIKATILTYIRPVIINSFKEEGEQYAAALNTVIDDATKMLQESLNIEGNIVDDVVDNFREGIVGGIAIAAEILIANPNIFIKGLGYILMYLGDKLPDVIRYIFGKSKESVMLEAVKKFNTSISDQIINQLKQPIYEQVIMQQEKIRESIKKNITASLKNVQDAIAANGNNNTNKDELEKKIADLQKAITELKQIKNQL